MGQKTLPTSLRLKLTKNWSIKSYYDNFSYGDLVHEDLEVQRYIKDIFRSLSIFCTGVNIKHSLDSSNINIYANIILLPNEKTLDIKSRENEVNLRRKNLRFKNEFLKSNRINLLNLNNKVSYFKSKSYLNKQLINYSNNNYINNRHLFVLASNQSLLFENKENEVNLLNKYILFRINNNFKNILNTKSNEFILNNLHFHISKNLSKILKKNINLKINQISFYKQIIKNNKKINEIFLKSKYDIFKLSFKNIRFKLRYYIELSLFYKNPSILGNFLVTQLPMHLRNPYPFLNYVIRILFECYKKYKLKGCLLQIKGRLRGARRKRTFKIQRGKIPTNTLEIKLPFFYAPVLNRYGVCSIKIWFFS